MKYDVFISYSSRDRAMAEEMAKIGSSSVKEFGLEQDGITGAHVLDQFGGLQSGRAANCDS